METGGVVFQAVVSVVEAMQNDWDPPVVMENHGSEARLGYCGLLGSCGGPEVAGATPALVDESVP